MTTFWHKAQYFSALTLIAFALLFSASIWSTTPSLAYLVILYSSGFGLLLTLIWAVRLSKTTFGKILLAINSLICVLSLGSLFKEQGDFENFNRYMNCIGNCIAALTTILFGILHFKKITNK